MATPPTVPAGWYTDPAARHERRYWDGMDWTAPVSDGGVTATDQPGFRPPPVAQPPAEPPPPAARRLGHSRRFGRSRRGAARAAAMGRSGGRDRGRRGAGPDRRPGDLGP